jgi:Fur family ferric uptake transcriptional regulator
VPRETSVDSDALLRRHGVNVTAQRLAVLRAVSDRPHSTADDIYTAVRTELGAISRQAVYDALGILTDKNLLRRIQPARSSARYENRVGDNHHHLICRTCNRMVDVDCAVGYTPCLTAADDRGYEIDEAEVVYWGRCPDCVGATSDLPVAEDGHAAFDPASGTRPWIQEQQLSRGNRHHEDKETAREEKDRRV